MNLTGKQLVEQGIVTGPIEKENVQQHGIDLNLVGVQIVRGDHQPGFVPVEGKTTLATRIWLNPQSFTTPDGRLTTAWKLQPGVYEVTFSQGCNIPSNQRAEIFQRSSLLRNGSIVRSSVFDAGFKTDKIGTVLVVNTDIVIECGARVAQFVCTLSNYVNPEDQYNGQWQGDKQRDALESAFNRGKQPAEERA